MQLGCVTVSFWVYHKTYTTICTYLSTIDNPSGITLLFKPIFGILTVTSSSISVENLTHLVSRMFLHEDEENQPSSYHILEVPLEAVAVGKDVDNKMEEEEKIVGDVASQGKRSRKLTEKGRSLKLSTLSNTRRKMNSRLVRQSVTIEDLMYSSKNYVTVEEALAQFDYIFKQLLLVHQEYHS